MLVRVIGSNFVAGLVFDEDGHVRFAAPILRWAIDMDEDQVRAELRRRGLRAMLVRTLTRPEVTAE